MSAAAWIPAAVLYADLNRRKETMGMYTKGIDMPSLRWARRVVRKPCSRCARLRRLALRWAPLVLVFAASFFIGWVTS